MSLFLAEIAGRMERERIDRLTDSLIPGMEYNLIPYRRHDEPKPSPVRTGMFFQRHANVLIFDGFILDYYPGYNSMVDAISGIPVLSLNGVGIYDLIPMQDSKTMDRFDVKIRENTNPGLKLDDLEKKLTKYLDRKKTQEHPANGTMNYVLRNGLVVNFDFRDKGTLHMLVAGNPQTFEKSVEAMRKIYTGPIEVTYLE